MKDTAMSMDLYNRLYWFFHIWLSAESLQQDAKDFIIAGTQPQFDSDNIEI